MIYLYMLGQYAFWAVVGSALVSIARTFNRAVTVMRDQLHYEQARDVREERDQAIANVSPIRNGHGTWSS